MFSPTSIANFLACPHLIALDRSEAAGDINRPFFHDPGLDLLIKLGLAHEEAYLRYLTETRELGVAKIETELSWQDAAVRTIAAMRDGAEVIYQATFVTDEWRGRADFLIRVDKPSELGAWSYEVVETKLARSTKARAIIQLCFYTDLLSTIQGVLPDFMHVVLGGVAEPEEFFVHRYLAYFRKAKHDFLAACAAAAETYPEPVEHCRICDWATVCDDRWRKDDHLSLVANITRNQRQALVDYGVATVADLASLTLPPQPKIERIKDQPLANIHQQAGLQVQGRAEGRNIHELLVPPEPGKGLCSLPTPSRGDMFLDFEGDQFAVEGGLEYLVGVLKLSDDKEGETVYAPVWAMNAAEEKRAFENFIAPVMERRRKYPDMHVYHYGSYEETAIKRMAGQHSTCGEEVDELLRGEVLVDLFRAVKQGLRASVESYSIKKLEPFYNYTRDVRLIDANFALQAFQAVLAFGPGEEDIDALRRAIEGYNRDDCVSTLRLREWLEELRQELEAQLGIPLPRPEPKEGEPSKGLSEYLQRVRAIEERLTQNLPEDKDAWTLEDKATALLANLLEWHRREDKSTHWEYFNRLKFSDDEFVQDKVTLGGLVYVGEVAKVKRSIIHRYRFPFQDSTIERALEIHDPKTKVRAGELHQLDYQAMTIDIKRGIDSAVPHPTALVPYDIVHSDVLRESLLNLGSWVGDNGIAGEGPHSAAREMLLRNEPRLKEGRVADFKELESMAAAKQIALLLDNAVLPIQGPPGSGKTFTGARMILELIKNGKKVGVTAGSHKVVTNLLKATCKAALETDTKLKIVQKCDGEDGCNDEMVKIAKSNDAVSQALADGAAQIVAGTVWLWSRPDMRGSVDVLFVDEAGQMSLANVLAASPAADSIVLLGDPQQLDQPQRGVHPQGAEASALSHLLDGHATITPDRGLFLGESWRLHPDVCAFTSEVFYEGRLASRPENASQQLHVDGPLGGTGLRFVPVEHIGNQSASPEEVDVVARLFDVLLRDATWTDKEGNLKRIRLDDMLIVAPYNAQVSLLLQRLPKGARVGTVDKFQGQEAPVVFYSMATSTSADAPRGMEFLYSSNRLNVATSRAQCLTVLVANPALFEVQCKTPRQIELANAFCRYLEMTP